MIHNGQRARGEPKSGPANKVNRGTFHRKRTPRWSLRRASKVAERLIRQTTGIVLIEPRNRGGRPPRDPAARARLEAGWRALAQVRLSLVLTYATSLEDLERLVMTSGIAADLWRRPWVIEELTQASPRTRAQRLAEALGALALRRKADRVARDQPGTGADSRGNLGEP